MVLGHWHKLLIFKANGHYIYRNKVQMYSSRDVKHKTMLKSTCGLSQESLMFSCDMTEMYGSNNCFTLKLPSETGMTPCVVKWPFSEPCFHRTV